MTTLTDHGEWASLLSTHRVAAALHAARLLDSGGSPVADARASYALYASDAAYPPEDLRAGTAILVGCELVLAQGSLLHPTAELTALCRLDEAGALRMLASHIIDALMVDSTAPGDWRQCLEQALLGAALDADAREMLLMAIGRKFDDAERRLHGELGEEHVVDVARRELEGLGLYDLAYGVVRVSAYSDDLGYDVVAPALHGRRRIEVKTTAADCENLVRFLLTRHEIEWGVRDPGWALAACHVLPDGSLELLGHCRAAALMPYLPQDSDVGRWTCCELVIPRHLLQAGLPSAV